VIGVLIVPVILPRVRHPSIWQACWLHYY